MKLPENWFVSTNKQSLSLLSELKKELPPGHKLFDVELTVVAYKDGTDDILCRYDSESDRYCLVHLTWLARQESDPLFPFVEFDGDFDSFLSFENCNKF